MNSIKLSKLRNCVTFRPVQQTSTDKHVQQVVRIFNNLIKKTTKENKELTLGAKKVLSNFISLMNKNCFVKAVWGKFFNVHC